MSWSQGAAIRVGGNGPSIRSMIRGNVIRGSRTGISLVGGSATITDNDVEASTTGILIHGADPFVSGNLLSGIAPGSIVVTGTSRATIERNAVDPSVHSRPSIGAPGVRPTVTTTTAGAR